MSRIRACARWSRKFEPKSKADQDKLSTGLSRLVAEDPTMRVENNAETHQLVLWTMGEAHTDVLLDKLATRFGVEVDKAEHHYETVIRVVSAAMEWTHLPTLGMAALAFAVMLGVRRLSPRLPNVLIAVVITTILSAAIDFEHDETVASQSIASPGLTELVNEFNRAVTARIEIDEVRSEGTEITAAIENGTGEFCQRCHTERPIERLTLGPDTDDAPATSEHLLALHQLAGLLDAHAHLILEGSALDPERRRRQHHVTQHVQPGAGRRLALLTLRGRPIVSISRAALSRF